MRVNVYEEELTDDIQIVSVTVPQDRTTAEPGSSRKFYGVRIFLKSSEDLHHTADDDDRSAVTFWVGTPQRAEILQFHLRRDLALEVRS